MRTNAIVVEIIADSPVAVNMFSNADNAGELSVSLLYGAALRHKTPPHGGTAFAHIFHLRAVFCRLYKLQFCNCSSVTGKLKRSRNFLRDSVHLFLLVRRVLRFACLTHAIAFNRFGKNHGGLTLVFVAAGRRHTF